MKTRVTKPDRRDAMRYDAMRCDAMRCYRETVEDMRCCKMWTRWNATARPLVKDIHLRGGPRNAIVTIEDVRDENSIDVALSHAIEDAHRNNVYSWKDVLDHRC